MREATVQIIKSILPIESADRLELAQVLGWSVVIEKGQFSIGDKCIYVGIDSLLPDKPEFEFMRSRKFRVKTIRLRGVLSQGIVFPMSILPFGDYKIDQNVSEILGVTHYEKLISAQLSGLTKGNFPSYVPKTDELMLQNYPGVIEEFRGLRCYITTKCNGTSSTFSFKDGEFDVCSRNWSKKDTDESVYWRMVRKYDIEKVLSGLGNYAIQAEIVGPGIQRNYLGLKEAEIRVFDVWNIDTQKYLDFGELHPFCLLHNLPMVPVNEFIDFYFSIDDLLIKAQGCYEGTRNRREGIVVRPIVNFFSEILRKRLSVKVLNNEYLLKNEA